MRDRILVEFGEIKGNLRKLWNLTKTEKLDRSECLNTVHEIDKSLHNVIALFRTSIAKRLAEIEPERLMLVETITRTFSRTSLTNILNEGLSGIERSLLPTDLPWLISKLENPQTYSDKDVNSSIINFCKDLEGKMITFETELDIKDELFLLAEFTSLFPAFTPNWIVAAVYLTAMEIVVKKELKKRNKELKDKFKENFQTLLSCLKEEGVKITELEKLLPSIFWNIRNKVIHEGYSPKDEELKTIEEYISRLIERL